MPDLTVSSAIDTFMSAADQAAARAALSLTVGVNVQAWDAELDLLAGQASTAFGRGALNLADQAAFRAYIGAGTSSFDGTWASLSGKPTAISTWTNDVGYITSAALASYQPLITAGTTAQYYRGDKTFQTLNAAAVAGLTAWATASYPTNAAGMLRNNGTGTLSWDTATYLTANQTITVSGDATGAGSTAITLTLATVPLAKGGTGATTQAAALNNLLPPQTGQGGKVLKTDGTDATWQTDNTSAGGSGVTLGIVHNGRTY